VGEFWRLVSSQTLFKKLFNQSLLWPSFRALNLLLIVLLQQFRQGLLWGPT